MACVDLQTIYDTECIGASLPKINGNFAALSDGVCNLSATPLNVANSSTINLTLINRTLLAEARVIPVDSGGTGLGGALAAPSQGTILIGNGTDYSLNTLSAGAGIFIDNKNGAIGIGTTGPQIAKAWINFDGTSGSIGTGRASYNVSSVTDLGGAGYYRITFSNAMPNVNYAVAGSCYDAITEPDPTTFGVVALNTNYVEVYSNRSDTGRIDNTIISAIVFST